MEKKEISKLEEVLMHFLSTKALKDCIRSIKSKIKDVSSDQQREVYCQSVLREYIISQGLSIKQIEEIFDFNKGHFNKDVREKIKCDIDKLMESVTEELTKIALDSEG